MTKSEKSDPKSWYLIIPIGFLYPLFFSKLFDTMWNKEDLEKKLQQEHRNIIQYKENQPRYYEEPREKLKFENDKFAFMMLIGVIGMASGMYLTKNIRTSIVGLSLATGGLLSILYSSVVNWNRIADYKKTGVIGLTMAILLLIAYKIMKNYSVEKPDYVIRLI